MDESLQKPESKMSLTLGIIGLLACVIMDALSFIPFVGDIEEVPAVLGLVLSVIFNLNQAVIMLEAVVDILKAIPVIQEAPLWTPAWIGIWWIESHPSNKLAQKAEQALVVASVVEGDVEELGETGAATATTVTSEATTIEGGAAAAGSTMEGAAAAEGGEITGGVQEGRPSEGTAGRNTSGGQESDTEGAGGEDSTEAPKPAKDPMASPEETNWNEKLQEQLEGASNTIQFPGGGGQANEGESDDAEPEEEPKQELPKAA